MCSEAKGDLAELQGTSRVKLLSCIAACIHKGYLVEDSTSSSNVFPLCAIKMSMAD